MNYLASDLGTTRLGLLSLDPGDANGNYQEKGQENVAEIHDCELSRLKWRRKGRSRGEASLRNGVRRVGTPFGIICETELLVLAVVSGKLP